MSSSNWPVDSAAPHGAQERAAGAIQVVNARDLPAERRSKVIQQLAASVHAVWRHCTDEFASQSSAERVLRERTGAHDEAVFVALTRRDLVAGTGSVAHDDFYEGFSRSNDVDPGHVGRDLWTVESWRGIVVDGLKIWEHLLRARLAWVDQRGGSRLTVFTEPGPVELPALYGRLGAVVLREGLTHRSLGRGTITMLGYPVRQTLHCLNALAHQRRQRAIIPAEPPRCSQARAQR